jgi:GR25 family glycosyltransferase involved in LPS biosynthesis
MIHHLKLINLDRTPERLAAFRARHPDLPVERIAAADGARLDRDACVGDGLITADNLYRPGALGCALSHIHLWRRCVAEDAAFHVVEDDVTLRHDFMPAASAILASLGAWEIVLWGHNLDWPVQVEPAPGLGVVVLQYDHQTLDTEAFRAPGAIPAAMRLMSAAGTSCYSISPAGAAHLLRACLPIGAAPARYLAKQATTLLNSGIDVEMSRHYADMAAFVAFPALAVSENDQTGSTIRGHLSAIHDPRAANRAVR